MKKQKKSMVHVYLTKEEKSKIEKESKKIGISTSSYIKVKLFSEKLMLFFILILVFGAVFSENAESVTDKRLYGHNGSEWVPILTNSDGTLKTDTNISRMTWDSILDAPTNLQRRWNLTSTNLFTEALTYNVGIGTSSPTHKLNVVGTSNFTANATFEQDVMIKGILYGGSPLKISGDINLTNGNIIASDGTIIIQNDGTGNLTTSDSLIVDYIYPNNNLVTQIKNLSIINDLRVTGNSYLGTLVFDANGTFPDSVLTDYIFPQSSGTTTVDNITILKDIRVLGNSYLGSFTIEDDLVIGSNNISSTDVILNGGNIGIGTTSPGTVASYDASANKVLNVYSASVTSRLVSSGNPSALDMVDTGGGSDDKWLQFLVDGGIGKFISYSDAGASRTDNIMVWDMGSGNVGIGTSSPDELLTVSDGNAGATIHIVDPTSGYAPTLEFSDNRDFAYAGAKIWSERDVSLGGQDIVFENTADNSAEAAGTYSERMRITKAGNVGIGTTSPLDPLVVVGAADDTPILTLRNTGDYNFSFTRDTSTGALLIQGDQVGYNNIVLVPTSGNVGIGTTSPDAKLDVAWGGFLDDSEALMVGADIGDLSTRTDATRKYGIITMPHYTNAEEAVGMFLFDGLDGDTSTLNLGGGAGNFNAATEIIFWTNANGVTLQGTERMRIDSSGNVGIGTTTPSAKLDIESDSDEPALNVSGVVRDGTDYLATFHNRAENDNALGVKILHATRAVSNDAFVVGTDSATSFKVGYDGKVGIGTATPASTLEVNGILTTAERIHATNAIGSTGALGKFLNSSIIIENAVAANDYSQLTFGYTRSWNNLWGSAAISYLPTTNAGYGAGALLFATRTVTTDTQPTERMRIDEDGNVGIGTTSPGSELEINGTGPTNPITRFTNTASYGQWDVYENSNQLGGLIGYGSTYATANRQEGIGMYTIQSGAPLLFLPGNAEKMRITTAGNVGIGTTTPGLAAAGTLNSTVAKFEVAGNIRLDNASMISSGEVNSIQFATCHAATCNTRYAIGEIRSFTTNGAAGGLRFYTSQSIGGGAYDVIPTMTISETGNVGIGTTAPSQKLNILGDNARILIEQADGTDTVLLGDNGADGGFSQFKDDSGTVKVNIAANGNSYFNAGNVGIGTTSPTHALNVVGDINATGDVMRDGGTVVTDYVFDYYFNDGTVNWSKYGIEENSSIAASYNQVELAELGQYLHSNRSLPGLPGKALTGQVSAGEIDRLLLEKLEEQAIYIIQLQERLTKLENNQNPSNSTLTSSTT